MIAIQMQVLHPELGRRIPLPQRMSEHASGFDVCAALDQPLRLPPGGRALVPCGFAVAVPPGYELQVRPRSGLAIKHGVGVVNAPGTIDADYRGEVKIVLINWGDEPFDVLPGERIAQLVPAAVPAAQLATVDALPVTARGSGGFGSTGR